MKTSSLLFIAFFSLMMLAMGLSQTNAQHTPTPSSTAFLTPNPNEIEATLTAMPSPFAGLSQRQQSALETLMRFGTVEFLADGSLQSTIRISESWLNDTVATYSFVTGYRREELSIDVQADGLYIQITKNGNTLLLHCQVYVSENQLLANFDWFTYNGVALDVSLLAEDEAILNNLLNLQTNVLLNSRVFERRIDQLSFSEDEIVIVSRLQFR